MVDLRLDDHINKLIHRSSLFRCLLDHPQNRTQLVNQVDASRTTVYRALEELQSHGLVSLSNNKFYPTPYGELLFYSLNELRQHAEKFQEFENFLKVFQEDTFTIHHLVTTGTIVESTCVNPRAPLRCLCDFINEASTIKTAAKVVHPEDAKAYYRSIIRDSTDCTVILQNKLVDQIYSRHESKFKKAVKNPASSILTTEESIPFSLIISEEPEQRVCVAIYDNRGNLQGVILNESSIIHEWAVKEFNRIKRHESTEQIPKRRSDDMSTEKSRRDTKEQSSSRSMLIQSN